MAQNKGPKFYFEIDGLRYGARNLTIAEQAGCLAKIEQLTNGNFKVWQTDEILQEVAFAVQAAVYLSVVICAWPTDMEPIDFLNSDDPTLTGRYWEAFIKASQDFRFGGVHKNQGSGVVGDSQAQEMVPGSLPSSATR
jgi:hypothetical protein